jgi:hypothetical protein
MFTEEALSFAYKFPFSKDAKEIVSHEPAPAGPDLNRILQAARSRLEEAFSKEKIEYRNLKYGKLDYVIGYPYCRLIVSAMANRAALFRYVYAEAERSKEAIENGNAKEIMRLAETLGLKLSLANDDFTVSFNVFLNYMADREDFNLASFRLGSGLVFLSRYELSDLLRSAMVKEILRGLPIKASEIPKQIIEIAKEIKPPKLEMPKVKSSSGSIAWIEQLLNTPIPDVRHRVVNLVLAPYLITVKGMSVDDAFKSISAYIERCKELDPNTKINDSYIRYQCEYAKKKGRRPLSLEKAKELLEGTANLW